MASQVTEPPTDAPTEAALISEITVAVPEPGWRHDLRALSIVWRRELIRFRTDRLQGRDLARPALSVPVHSRDWTVQPGRALAAVGNRLQNLHLSRRLGHVGALHIRVLRRVDRVGPGVRLPARDAGGAGRRGALVVGKCLGGATIATFQGIVFLALAGFAHVPYNPVLLLTLIGMLLLLSFTLTAFGVMMAARITQFQSFMALTQMLVMPLFFLSGALYPLNGLPAWLSVLTRLDPLTYIVGPMRHAVFSYLDIPSASIEKLAPGVTWGGWVVPVGVSLGIVALMGLTMMVVAIAEFGKTE